MPKQPIPESAREKLTLASSLLKAGKTLKTISKRTGLSVKFLQRNALDLLMFVPDSPITEWLPNSKPQ